MKTIARRLQKLEHGFRLGPETESERQLRAQIEEGRRRVAEARVRGVLPPASSEDDREGLSGRSAIEILQRGRARVAARFIEHGDKGAVPISRRLRDHR